jgi:hypothetical protein
VDPFRCAVDLSVAFAIGTGREEICRAPLQLPSHGRLKRSSASPAVLYRYNPS